MTISMFPAASCAMVAVCCLPGAEATERRDFDRELGHPTLKCFQMLGGEHRGGDQHRNLKSRVDCLEGRPNGNFCLAKTDIATEQTVHRSQLTHVRFDRRRCRELVRRFLVWERRIEFPLPMTVFRKADALTCLAPGLDIEHFHRHVGDCRFRLFFFVEATVDHQFAPVEAVSLFRRRTFVRG